MNFFYVAFEDAPTLAIIKKVFNIHPRNFIVGHELSRGGFGYLKKNINSFNLTAKGFPFLVVTDLDKADCVPILIGNWFTQPIHNNLLFCVAVKEIESWILSDRENFSIFFGVQKKRIPFSPDDISDPKKYVLDLIAKSRKNLIKRDMLPSGNSKIGRHYNDRLVEFIYNHWDVDNAKFLSPSLNRLFNKLTEYKFLKEE